MTIHGFRSTLKDYLLDQTDTPHYVTEEILAHKPATKLEQAYRRTSALNKRGEALELWATYLTA